MSDYDLVWYLITIAHSQPQTTVAITCESGQEAKTNIASHSWLLGKVSKELQWQKKDVLIVVYSAFYLDLDCEPPVKVALLHNLREGAKNILRGGGCQIGGLRPPDAPPPIFQRPLISPPPFSSKPTYTPPQTPSFKKKISMSPPKFGPKKTKFQSPPPHIWGKKGENQ